LLLRGPSGCAKSMTAYRIGLDSIGHRRVPIFLQAKNFERSLRPVVNQEATLLGARSGDALVNACQRLMRPMLFILDGYNECPEAERGRLTRSIAAAARRYEASVVVTAQAHLDRP